MPRVMTASRFAPSPTGWLHLGHAWSALAAHDRARSTGGRFLLRIDDLDTGRVRASYREGIDTDLAWLGLAPDDHPLVQSERLAAYDAALARLKAERLAYPCFCTRADIAAEAAAAVAAPHGPDGPVYPGTCRALDPACAADRIAAGAPHVWRLDVTKGARRTGALSWTDERLGKQQVNAHAHGDIVLARRDAPAAYHLASTVDDAAMMISHVVRGADLVASTHIHRLLQALLELPTPLYRHHQLIGDAEGRRLAKRNDAASIAALRTQGVDPARLVADLRDGVVPLGYRWIAA